MMKLSRKPVDHYESVKLWVQELNESENTTLFTVHKNGPFFVWRVFEWQKEFLENLEEWCIDSTYKISKSFNTVASKGPEDCFQFTISVQNPITNKGLPVYFFITDHEYTSILSQ
ncbi:hypothetical protein PHYBLDRAFT_72195 [Phycomyces blakesleeanus NRRL 1555(-)]|uniref:Uncharacterized protein n=1 Tax=Phycomyces blakesleeanus (strain ATCC 8743b / DSM 1359 / FGSC 10004 / NBRC 33097 / NRRL 1555) TaxID=763407 RepID=A0A162NBU1_PHYB8|nr:hypothetical protein PHYBLDRAFT_72195 [Phycomyces blakesleeanus NRRL 1555(-)]OAD67784.1 hypothetical protein PHYBLDRAFT_72195 [Phycomyces blakesleeanus NRRL 1555(-)]|eukprot:XP_018285824.1 hypothetical protein PHYBLDRAFT_72195 [Phycomyces blakesleeanus NRRL 1555(-)]